MTFISTLDNEKESSARATVDDTRLSLLYKRRWTEEQRNANNRTRGLWNEQRKKLLIDKRENATNDE